MLSDFSFSNGNGASFIKSGNTLMTRGVSSGQGTVSVSTGTQSSGTQITLTDSSGNVIASFTPALDFSSILLSAPQIQTGASYTLRIGNATQTITAK